MKILLMTSCLILALVTLGWGQSPVKQKNNALSFELGKTGLIYNLNYDHKINATGFGYRLGAGSNLAKYFHYTTVGGGGYYLIGKQNHFLELGAEVYYVVTTEESDDQRGVLLVYPDYPVKTFYESVNIGYRSYGKQTLFRLGISPGLIEGKFFPGGYISFGVTF